MIVIGAIFLIVVVAMTVFVGVAALREHKAERTMQCGGCGRTGPFPERVVMARRHGHPAFCPDCGTPLTRRGTSRSDWSGI